MNREQQERLTRVGPGTPMGELLRRYWFPVAVSSELAPGTARAVRLLGEDFVLFRTPAGRCGLLAELCTHRASSLRCGIVEDTGIRCPYHGWKFASDGACVEMPGVEPSARLLERARTKAGVVGELGGFVFAYLGPAPAPLLPRYDLFVWNGVLRDIGRALIPCNWLQIMENSVDPLHVEWLHGHHLGASRLAAGETQLKYYGRPHARIGFEVFRYGIIKRRIVAGGTEEDDDWKIGHPLIFPTMLRVGTQGQHRFQIRVPVDDTHTQHWWYACYRPPAGAAVPAQSSIPVYDVPWQDGAGNFITDFVDGGDIMAWVTQGPIADRTREVLNAGDKGVALYRRLLREQMRRVQRGEDPMGVIRDAQENELIAFRQEENKFRAGGAFLREAIEVSHVRYSPLKQQILELMSLHDG